MLLDLIALGIFSVFVVLGTLRGAVASGASVLTLAVSYASAWWGAKTFGEPLAESLGLPAIAGSPLAGCAVFIVSLAACGAASALLRGWDRRRRQGRSRGPVDRLLGAVFGALRGSLVVVLLAWLALWLDAAHALGNGERLAGLPDTRSSAVAAATGQLVERAVEAALSESATGSRVVSRLAARPRETVDRLRELLDDPRIQAVQDDELFWSYVENGSVASALNRGSFWDVVNDVSLRRQLAGLGLIDEASAADARVFRDAAADVLQKVGPRLKGLSSDAEVQSLARDPEIVALLESGDTLGLLRHRGVQKIMSRVAEGL